MIKTAKTYYQQNLLAVIPTDLQETIHQQLLDKIYAGLFWLSIFMPLHIVLQTLWMFEKVPLTILLPWSTITGLLFLSAIPLRYYFKHYQSHYSCMVWYRWLFILSFFASVLFGLTPWLMFQYLNPSEVILFSAVLSFGVVVQIMVLSGFITLWLIATLPVVLLVTTYSYFYWDFNNQLGQYFAGWALISSTYMFFMALQHNKAQIKLLVLQLQLSDANHAKSRFLAVMSHEVRTPLSSIIGMADLLKEEALTSKQSSYTHNIYSAGRNLLHILNNILLMSSLQAKLPKQRPENFSIRELVDDVVSSFSDHARRKNLHLHWQIDAQITDFLSGDSARIRQILMNLIANAIKFTEQGEVKLVLQADVLDRIRFSVYDTGVGIDQHAKKIIFKEFSQVNPLQKNNFEGVGLGLTIVTELVKLLQGELVLESELGKGSCFHIILPLSLAKQHSSQATSHSHTSIELILVEDDDLNREISTRLLQRYGHHVHAVINAEEALKIIKMNAPQLLVTDLNLPGIGGIELAEKLQISHPNLPIIALTANATMETQQACLTAGMQAVLTKPIDGKTFNQAINQQVVTTPPPSETPSTKTKVENSLFSTTVAEELADVMTSSEIKDLYLRSIEKIQIEFTAMQQNNGSTHSQLHRLSGSCANLGFVHLSQTLQAIKICLSNDKSSQKLMTSLLPLLDKSKNEVIDFIDNNAKS